MTEATLDFSRYAGRAKKESTPEEQRVLTEPISAVESRTCIFGIVPVDAIRTMDKRKIAIVADATLDDVIDGIGQLFAQLQLCDTCEEPATREGEITVEDRLDTKKEFACDGCKFSRGVKKVRPTSTAEAVRRMKALIVKIQDRR